MFGDTVLRVREDGFGCGVQLCAGTGVTINDFSAARIAGPQGPAEPPGPVKHGFMIYPSRMRSVMRWTVFVVLLTAFSCGSDEEISNPVSSLPPFNPPQVITTAVGTCQVGMVLGPGGSCGIGNTGHTLRIENDSLGSACVGARCFPPVSGITVNFNDNGVLIISVRSDRGPSIFSPDQWTIVAIG